MIGPHSFLEAGDTQWWSWPQAGCTAGGGIRCGMYGWICHRVAGCYPPIDTRTLIPAQFGQLGLGDGIDRNSPTEVKLAPTASNGGGGGGTSTIVRQVASMHFEGCGGYRLQLHGAPFKYP